MVDPAVLHRSGGEISELHFGCGQQVAGAVAEVLERFGGVGVALAGALAVGVVVVGPAVEVGVFVGVDVPRVEDLLAVAQVAVEVTEELAVCGVVGGDGEGPVGISGERPGGRHGPWLG